MNKQSTVQYAKILADGKFHIKCEETDEGAVKRTYKDKDENDVVVWEQVFTSFEDATIQSLEIKDGDYGRVLYIGLDDDVVISVNTANNFGTDFMKKIPNIDMSKPVTIFPFSFVGDKGKDVKGVSITQEGNKITSFFQEKKGGKTVNTNGYPEIDESKKSEPTAKTAWRKFWKNYFETVDDFLVEYIEKNHLIEYKAPEKTDEKETDEEVPF